MRKYTGRLEGGNYIVANHDVHIYVCNKVCFRSNIKAHCVAILGDVNHN